MSQKLEYKIERHPLSSAFPNMTTDEFVELLDSVREIGIQVPIVLFEDKIIDGWHRYRASVELDIECPAIDLADDLDPQLFVIAHNLARRNLSASQRALSSVKVFKWRTVGRINQSSTECEIAKTNKEISDISKTSERTVGQAKKVISNAVNEVIEAVQSGKIGIVKASEIAKLDKDKQVAALNKPVKKTVPKEVVPDYDPSDDLRETISVLNEELVKATQAAALGVLKEGMESAKEIIERQAEEIKNLKIENDGLRATRDTDMVEIKELKKQCKYYQKKIKDLTK